MKLFTPTEQDEAKWLMQWAHYRRWGEHRLSDLLIHIPNGAYGGKDRKTAAITFGILKAMGLQPGCFDYILPVPCMRLQIPGLWLELKRIKGGRVDDDQKEFEARMIQLGWRTQVSPGWKHAADAIDAYLFLVSHPSQPIGAWKPQKFPPQ